MALSVTTRLKLGRGLTSGCGSDRWIRLAEDRGFASWSSREISVGNYGWCRGGFRRSDSMSDTAASFLPVAGLAPRSRKLSSLDYPGLPARGSAMRESPVYSRECLARAREKSRGAVRGKSESRGSIATKSTTGVIVAAAVCSLRSWRFYELVPLTLHPEGARGRDGRSLPRQRPPGNRVFRRVLLLDEAR